MGNFLCPPRITADDVVAVRAEAYREARQLLEADSVELEEWVMTLQEEKSRLAFGERLRTLTFELNAPFGIGLSSRNRVLEVAEGSAAEGVVAVGDCVVEVDDTSVRDAIRNVADAVDPKRALHTLVVERIAPPSAETAAMAAEEMLNAEISRLREEAAAAKATAKTASDNLAARLQALYGTPAAASGDEGAAAEE